MVLTRDEHEQYRRDGYLLVSGLVDASTIEGIDARFQALVMGEAPAPESLVIMKDVAFAKNDAKAKTPLHAVNKVLSFEDDPVLWSFAVDERIVARVRDLVGPELKTLSTNVFNKPPGVDGRHPMHQDLRYFALRPADGILGTWTAIDRCTRENGCLSVIPGSHRGPLAEHGELDEPGWEEVNFGFFAARGVDLHARTHIEMEPGDTLFFHPLLVHGSGRNRSSGFRRSVSVHYASVDCHRPDDMKRRRPSTRRISTTIRRVPSS